MKINTKKPSKSVEKLENIIHLLQQEIQKQQQEIISYKERYIRLLEEFKLEKSRRYSSSSEKNILQADMFDEPGVELPEELKNQLDDTVDIASYQRKKHQVRKPIPKEMPRDVIVHDIPENEKICSCGTHLVRIGEEISEQIKYIPAQLSVIQHVCALNMHVSHVRKMYRKNFS